MKAIIRTITYPRRGDHIDITPLFDTHVGNAACDEVLLRQTVKRIAKEKNHYWIGGGDYCLSEDTEVLTKNGWRGIDDLSPNDLVLVYDPSTEGSFYQKTDRKWVCHPEEMVLLSGAIGIDMLVTKEHRVLCERWSSWRGWRGWEVKTAKEFNTLKAPQVYRVPVSSVFTGEIEDEDWAELLGWIVTEGWSEKAKGKSPRISISQSERVNQRFVDRIEALLIRLALSPHRRVYERTGVVTWRFNVEDTKEIVSRLDLDVLNVHSIPRKWLNSHNVLPRLFETLIAGDGDKRGYRFSTVRKGLADQFQEICFKLGYRCNLSLDTRVDGKIWSCYYGKERSRFTRIWEVKHISYDKRAWCVSTKQGFIVARRNNAVFVTGNCDYINRKDRRHKETSLASYLHGIDDIARMQRDRVISILEPIKDKCLGLLRGNHEGDFLKYYEVDIYASMVDRLRIDHKAKIMLGIQGFIILRLSRRSKGAKRAMGESWPIKIYCHHGYGGGRLEGGHALALGRMFKDYNCDIGLMGHRHVKQVLPRVQTTVTRDGRVYDRYQVGAFCGSFLKSYSEAEVYAEEKGLPALPLGPIRIRLWPAQRKIEVTV